MNFRKIIYAVFGIHGAIVAALWIHHFFAKEPPKKKIVVNTFKRPDPSKSVVVKAPKVSAIKKDGVKQNKSPPKAPPQKKLPSKEEKKKTVLPSQEKKESTPSSEGKELSQNQIKKEIPLSNQALVDPHSCAPKEDLLIEEYGGVLISFFQENLDLPDFGEVKMKIEIDGQGKVISLNVLYAESQINEEFLKIRLPELVCPCFNGNHNPRNSFEFTILFKNR